VYADTTLRGSATFSDPDGDLEGISTYRWLVNGTQVASGDVPQSLLLPLDGSLLTTDGEAPTASQGLTFVAGRFGQAVQTSAGAHSNLSYSAAGNVDSNEGSIDMWVNLTYDLDDPVYNDHPHLFAYDINDEHLLHMEVDSGRIGVVSANGASYYSAWPAPPGWQAGDWHHLAATWSASANHLVLYYDCAMVADDDFPGLTGSASSFYLGTVSGGRVMDAAFDDVRLSRRSLSADEVAGSCSRHGPAPNDEVNLPSGQAAVGDVVTFELTPCDETGVCGPPTSASATVTVPPLGVLQPLPGLLSSGAISVTLSLTTTAPAECRWSDQPDTPYDRMPRNFQHGQGMTLHSTVVSGLHDLAERWFHVRCEDLSTGRDPDDYQRETHLRVLGPWDGGYPRIANLWGDYGPELAVRFLAGYELSIPYSWPDPGKQAPAIRAVNPNVKILHTQKATKGRPESDLLAAEWWSSVRGEPGYDCLLRDSSGDILLVEYWGHPMYNMTVPYCRAAVVKKNVDVFLSQLPDQGASLAYDGIYWDLLHAKISWLGDDIDSDLDGRPDNPDALDAAYQAGVADFLAQVRARLPHAILMGNEAPGAYTPWINGRLYEWQLAVILDGADWLTWEAVMSGYRDWTGRGHTPHTTLIQSAPEALYSEKYTFQHLGQMPESMEAEAAASYQRMRYGLASALMGDGLFSYDYGPDWHGSLWWYDEFGAPGDSQTTTLPPRGYLGQPTGDPMLLADGAELWLGDVQFQAGVLGVWARPFSNGLAVINPTQEVRTVPLSGVYCKLKGSQAPLFQMRVDDDEAEVSAGWIEQPASYSQFGATVQVASGHSAATVTYIPSLAHSGRYEVLAWVAPAATQSSAVPVTIGHVQGETLAFLDQTAGEVGWHSLGTYTFDAGESGGAVLAATGDGLVVADAFKWVSAARYNDGSRVSQVTLQPQDGIVLLSSCYRPGWQAYLPVVTRHWTSVQIGAHAVRPSESGGDSLGSSVLRMLNAWTPESVSAILLLALLLTIALLQLTRGHAS